MIEKLAINSRAMYVKPFKRINPKITNPRRINSRKTKFVHCSEFLLEFGLLRFVVMHFFFMILFGISIGGGEKCEASKVYI